MIAPSSPSPEPRRHSPLCPECGATSIRIRTSIEVEVDVVVEDPAAEMIVMDELLGDAMWDERTLAVCPACSWQGTVGDLRRRALTALGS
ncbi:MAG TPA: hypothetical protein VKB31_07105 [Trueperaceae bacterium]|nr:hypothetical protein [Trueperaceae bacterium]